MWTFNNLPDKFGSNICGVTRMLVVLVALLNDVKVTEGYFDRVIKGLGDNQRLHCNNVTSNDTLLLTYQPSAWILPNLTVIYPDTKDPKYILEDQYWTLVVRNVTNKDLGVYHCMMKVEEDQWYLVKLGLNSRGPYFEDLWEVYKINTIIGLTAMGVFLLLVVTLYLFCLLKPEWFDGFLHGGATDDIPYTNDLDREDGKHSWMKPEGSQSHGATQYHREEVKVAFSNDGKDNLAFSTDTSTRF